MESILPWSRASPLIRGSAAAFRELIGVAHAHLRNALDYTLLIPSKETGHTPILLVGDRARRPDAAQDRAQSALYGRRQVKVTHSRSRHD